MIDVAHETEIAAPPTAVFDVLADPQNHLEFTPSLVDISGVESTDVGKRGRYAYRMLGVTFEGRFDDAEFDPPQRRRYELDGDIGGTVTWTVEVTEDGTSLVRHEASLSLPIPGVVETVLTPVARPFLGRQARETLENLKALLEAGDRSATPPA